MVFVFCDISVLLVGLSGISMCLHTSFMSSSHLTFSLGLMRELYDSCYDSLGNFYTKHTAN